jgi:hypothetical protein
MSRYLLFTLLVACSWSVVVDGFRNVQEMKTLPKLPGD